MSEADLLKNNFTNKNVLRIINWCHIMDDMLIKGIISDITSDWTWYEKWHNISKNMKNDMIKKHDK